MSMEDDLKALNKIEKAEIKKLEQEQKSEEKIINAIAEITSNLLTKNICEAEINGLQYLIKFRAVNTGNKILNNKGIEVSERRMILAVSKIAASKIYAGRYRPMTITFPFDENLTFKGNLTVAVEAAVRHITGTIKPEVLSQENKPVNVKVVRDDK